MARDSGDSSQGLEARSKAVSALLVSPARDLVECEVRSIQHLGYALRIA